MLQTLPTEIVRFSPLDSDRFGIRALRAHITSENLLEVLESCLADGADLLIARCSTTDIACAQAAEQHGFLLTDTLVYYQYALCKPPIPSPSSDFRVRFLQPGDESQVRSVAAAAFQGYFGHYHADSRLDPIKCDEAYASWAERSCIPGLAADQVVIAEHDSEVAGFGSLRLNSPEEVEGLLFAVHPDYQRRGVCSILMSGSLDWARAQRAERMIISTQLTNVSMQKVWCRTGFEFCRSFYTFHRWFER